MKIKWRVVFIFVPVMLVGLFIGCSDSLDKTTFFNKFMRVEYSDCTGCLECINDFNCPEGAIKIDDRTQTVYIDADLCTQCMDCINLFNCPEDAFTTLPDQIAPASIGQIVAISDSIGKMEIQFTATGDDSTSGRAYRYELVLEDQDGQIILNDFEIPAPLSAGNQESWMLYNLPENDTITIQIQAFDEVELSSGITSETVVIMGEIIDEEPPSDITDLLINSISMNSFTLNWTAVGDDGMEGTAEFYIIKIHTEEITEQNWDSIPEYEQTLNPLPSGNSEALIITGLEPDTDYFAAIKVLDEVQNISTISNVAQATTTEIPDTIPPSAINDLLAAPTDVEINLSWTSPGDDGDEGTAFFYEIKKSIEEITEENWNDAELLEDPPLPQPAGTQQSYTAEGLVFGITYYFGIKAFDESQNVSPLSNIPSTALLEDNIPPATITDLEVIEGYAVNLSTIKIRWTAPGDDGDVGTASSYEIRYALDSIDESNWDAATVFADPPDPEPAGTIQNCNITGLPAGTIYYFAIKAYDNNSNVNEVSNSPGGKLVYQINTAACNNCSYCIGMCSVGAIQQGAGYKYIDPDICDACGNCSCPWNLIYPAVIAY